MPIDILNFILKSVIIIPFARRDKEEISIIGIHRVIFIVLEQREELKCRLKRRMKSFLFFAEMKFIDLIWNKDNISNRSQPNQRRRMHEKMSVWYCRLNSSEFNACQFNPEHELFACGSIEVKLIHNFKCEIAFFFSQGHVECYDPRVRSLIGQIDCAVFANSSSSSGNKLALPAVSCLKFKDALNLSVGMSTGQVSKHSVCFFRLMEILF